MRLPAAGFNSGGFGLPGRLDKNSAENLPKFPVKSVSVHKMNEHTIKYPIDQLLFDLIPSYKRVRSKEPFLIDLISVQPSFF